MFWERRHCHVFFTGLVVILAMATPSSIAQALEGCQDTCGNLTIPYPFGTRKGCYHDSEFLITCNTSFSSPKMFLTGGNIEVTNISILEGQLIILSQISHDCYYKNGLREDYLFYSNWFSKFKISDSMNIFTVVGCDVYAFIIGYQGNDTYQTGCMSVCDTRHNIINGSCTGVGCCQTLLPKGVDYYEVQVKSLDNHTKVWNFNPCGYAFVVEENKYKFSVADLEDLRYTDDELPVVVDWTIGNETCGVARKSDTYVCGNNSNCLDPDNGSGYRCSCLEGYEGNPYLLNGCQDIDECRDPSLNQCEVLCINTVGNYTCSCPKGYYGNGRKDGHGCIRVVDQSLAVKIFVGTIACLVILFVACAWVYLIFKKRNHMRMKEKFFRQNGGVMLQQQLSNQRERSKIFTIYSAEALEKATDFYSEKRIIGKGGYGTVYKGILSNSEIVAIKKSKVVDETQKEQFINEVIVLSQINNRNVVKLMGCCLETEVPLLVYEFIPNGTLYDHIHNRDITSLLTWNTVLKIVGETAGVLSYLHSVASVPIIHRDIKSTNILLDDNLTAKVSDFGSSRLVPLDKMQLSTMVQGTIGYLDPEYFHTSQLTEKSDVYSFGVVLVEILTKRKALCFEKPEKERNLATYFISSLKEGRLFQILDKRISREAGVENMILVSELAKRCLSLRGEERPTMTEVFKELEGLKTRTSHPWVGDDNEETQNLIDVRSETFGIESSREVTIEYDSITENMELAVHGGR